MPKTYSYITDQPTQHFGIPRMRVDLVERLKHQARARKMTLNELVNSLIESGCNHWEGLERAKEARDSERERIKKSLKSRINEIMEEDKQ